MADSDDDADDDGTSPSPPQRQPAPAATSSENKPGRDAGRPGAGPDAPSPMPDPPPDTAAGLSYPPGAKFTHHFDTRHLYREARGDVSLGVASAVYFHASETALRTQHVAHNGGHNKQVVVALPPRSLHQRFVQTSTCGRAAAATAA